MVERIAATIARYRMFAPGQRVGVAVSGGADSVCLLHVLLELNLQLSVLHVNHALRGQESDGDAQFVRALADRLGLPCTVRDAPVAGGPDNLEQAARKARLAFFHETIAGGGADRVALGHTRSDQAETVLFRFLRGSGTAGLAGIRPVTGGGLVRPLIEIDREEIRAWLDGRAIAWCEDSTNRSPEFARNRIRHHLLPQLAREWNPGIAETLAQTADWALAEETWWETEIARLAGAHLVQNGDAVLVRGETLGSLPLAAARRLIRRAMELAKGDLRGIGFRHVAAVLDLAAEAEGGRTQAPGLDICRSFEWIRFARPIAESPYCLQVPGTSIFQIPGTGFSISLELIENSETSSTVESVYNNGMGCLDWSRLSGPLELRNWQPGDRYQPEGASGEEKIKDLFQRARVPLWERAQWPVLGDARGIVWAHRFGPATRCAAGQDCRLLLNIREVTAR